MTITKRQKFIFGQAVWLCGSLLVLAALSALSLELYFILALIGFLVLVQLTAPLNLTPQWRKRLWRIMIVGLIVFAVIVVMRLLEFLPASLL
jgi:hypothetical protein